MRFPTIIWDHRNGGTGAGPLDSKANPVRFGSAFGSIGQFPLN